MKKSIVLKSLSVIVAVFAMAVMVSGLSAPSADAATNSCRYYNYNRGDTGYCVRMAQTLLKGPFTVNVGGFTANLATDSSYGPATEAAAYKWQRVYGLKYDGVVGPQTWRSLCSFGAGGGVPNTTAASRDRYNAAFSATCL